MQIWNYRLANMTFAQTILLVLGSLLLLGCSKLNAEQVAKVSSFHDLTSLLQKGEIFVEDNTPAVIAVALYQYDQQQYKQYIDALPSSNTTALFLTCQAGSDIPQGLRGGYIRRMADNPSIAHAGASSQICLGSAEHSHQRFKSKFEEIISKSGKMNLLLIASKHLQGLVRSLVFVTLQYHNHFNRVAVATDTDGVINHVSIIDMGAGKRVEFRRSQLHSVFQDIYDRKVWSDAGLGSGVGSTLDFTQKLRDQLHPLLIQLGVKTMVDAPCGGMLWMPLVLQEVEKTVPDFRYFGLDVSCGVIGQIQQRLANHTNWQFKCQDVTDTDFPVQAPDLVFSRDALQHLSLQMIHNFLKNVKRQKAKYLLVGSYLDVDANRDIAPGDYFSLNLLKPPFNLRPQPVLTVKEQETPAHLPDPQKYMILLDVEKMQWDAPPGTI